MIYDISKFFGVLAFICIIFAIFHVVGLFSYLYDGEIFTKIGLAAFIMLLIVAIAGMFLKKLPIQYKKQGFKTHMFLGITVFILVLLHLAL